MALAALAVGAACFAGGRYSVSAPAPVAPKCARSAGVDLAQALVRAQPADKPQPKIPLRDLITLPVHLTQAPDEDAAKQLRDYEERQGHDLVGLLRARVRRASIMAGNPEHFEAVVGQLNEYVAGWVDALVRTSPTLMDDLAQEVENALCDPATPAVEVMLYARLGRLMPELTSATGFECVLNTGIEEGPVLWETLATLRVSGLPEPKAVAAIEARAQNETTLRILHPEPAAAEDERESAPSEGPQLSAEEQRAVLDGLLAERSQGLKPLPGAETTAQ